MFAQMIRDGYPSLPGDSVTMVVQNKNMIAGVRWQDWPQWVGLLVQM